MAICKALKKLQLTYKKTLRHPKVDEDARQAFQQKIQQYNNEEKTIVSLMKVVLDYSRLILKGSVLKYACEALLKKAQ